MNTQLGEVRTHSWGRCEHTSQDQGTWKSYFPSRSETPRSKWTRGPTRQPRVQGLGGCGGAPLTTLCRGHCPQNRQSGLLCPLASCSSSRPPASCLVASEGQATPHASSTCRGTCRGQTPRRQRGRHSSLSRAPSHVGGAVVCEIHLSALSLPSLGSLSQFKLPLTPKSDPGPQPQQVPGGIPPATCISEPSCKARLSPGPLTICRSEGPRPPPRGH